MQRTLGVQTLTGLAQPILGDVTTAAVVAAPDGVPALITVASTTIYQVGDRIVLEPNTVNSDAYRVSQIQSSTILQCVPEAVPKAHLTGVIIAFSLAFSELTIQAVYGTAVSIWIGSDNTVTNAGLGNVVYQLTPNLPFKRYPAGGNNPNMTTEFWFAATSGTQAIVAIEVV
jgi:hypothetical protein